MRQDAAIDGFRLAYERTGQTGRLDGAGHFTPLECPRDFAAAIKSGHRAGHLGPSAVPGWDDSR